jgi:hypothetical protein
MVARVKADDTLRVGIISVVHGFDRKPAQSSPDGPKSSSVSAIINMDEFDPISGIPRMSALRVHVAKLADADAAPCSTDANSSDAFPLRS